jgi:hypothetical protein
MAGAKSAPREFEPGGAREIGGDNHGLCPYPGRTRFSHPRRLTFAPRSAPFR